MISWRRRRAAGDNYARFNGQFSLYLKNIRIPSLLIQANDDPFMTAEDSPQQTELSDMLTLEITRGGGHVGFVSGDYPFKPKY